jgi:choline dehydrogenase
MLLVRFLGVLTASVCAVSAVDLTGYEYVVVGSGAGGGPVAARLAMAGHKTLLIEAGDDQGSNVNYTTPAYNAKASEDEQMAWNFFVRHYADEERQARDHKTSYDTPDGSIYTGPSPPPGSKMKGTLYPRTGTLGGCTAHNAMVTIYPHQSDFEYMATLTGDASWEPANMRKYFTKLERNHHLLPGLPGHGYQGWLQTETAPLTIALKDPQLLSLLLGGAFALGNLTNSVLNLATLIAGDANANTHARDIMPGYYQVPLASDDAHRTGSREFVVSVRDARNWDGSKKYPLDVRMNCHVTKIIFDNSTTTPRAVGVEFLDGKHLYKASPLSGQAGLGTPGTARASREVIISGGAYNSPQLLKLSGVGPRAELERFGIPVVVDLPGVGTNLQDHYEIAVQGRLPNDLLSFKGCTFSVDGQPDPCLERWKHPILGDHGLYASSGMAGAMLYKSTATGDGSYDIFAFGGPINFRGYFPRYSINITQEHDLFTWVLLKSHPRNNAGSVTLRSADPLDTPEIVFNYFDTGSGDASADLQALYEAVELGRDAFARQLVPIEETLPGKHVQTKEDIQQYAQDTAWGHHASSTCPIGPDGDPMAVLDSSFRVRGVSGLRVVDASVYPRIREFFPSLSTPGK